MTEQRVKIVKIGGKYARYEYQKGPLSVALRGVNPAMRRLFYDGYTRAAARTIEPLPIAQYRTEREVAACARAFSEEASSKKSKVRSAKSGMTRGTKVDNALTRVVRWYGKYHDKGITPWSFLAGRKRSMVVRRSIPIKDQREIKKLAKSMHFWSQAILRVLKVMNLFPFMAQVRCGSKELRTGTEADLVCRPTGQTKLSFTSEKRTDKRVPVVVVELKTGYQDYYLKYGSNMLGICSDLPNSPHWQHQLQLLCTVKLFEATYSDQYAVKDAFILRVDNNGLHLYRLHDRVKSLWSRIRAKLKATASTATRSRSRKVVSSRTTAYKRKKAKRKNKGSGKGAKTKQKQKKRKATKKKA
jgi:hypothetical protein